jgi:hypothetical protein
MKNRLLQIFKRWLLFCFLCLSPIFISCQTQHPLVLEPIGPPVYGPAPGKLALVGTGFLKVYSATETRQVGKFINYYPHTPYLIYTTNGQRLHWVANSVATIDETPALVRLPAGFYTVRAQDDNFGRISVPVVIEGGLTTTLHLETRVPRGEQPDAAHAVQLPDGRVAGWRAREAAPEIRQ